MGYNTANFINDHERYLNYLIDYLHVHHLVAIEWKSKLLLGI